MMENSLPTAAAAKEKVYCIEDIEEGKGGITSASHVEGNALLVARDGAVRKLPVPSSDPNDPLNFSRSRKIGIIIACCWFCKCLPSCRHPCLDS